MPKRAKPGAVAPRVIETFALPSPALLDAASTTLPYVWNGEASVRKWRITVEMIDEPVEEIRARIVKMFTESRNTHHIKPLIEEAKKYGLDLGGVSFGSAAKAAK